MLPNNSTCHAVLTRHWCICHGFQSTYCNYDDANEPKNNKQAQHWCYLQHVEHEVNYCGHKSPVCLFACSSNVHTHRCCTYSPCLLVLAICRLTFRLSSIVCALLDFACLRTMPVFLAGYKSVNRLQTLCPTHTTFSFSEVGRHSRRNRVIHFSWFILSYMIYASRLTIANAKSYAGFLWPYFLAAS